MSYLGKFDSLRVGERASLFVDVVNVENLGHELDDRLSLSRESKEEKTR